MAPIVAFLAIKERLSSSFKLYPIDNAETVIDRITRRIGLHIISIAQYRVLFKNDIFS